MRVPYRKPGKFSQIKQDPLLTQAKFTELEKKLNRLKTVSRPEVAAEVRRLAEMGDFSENAAYQMAKGRLRGINQTIDTIEFQLDHAVVIPPQAQTDTVDIGHTVTVTDGVKEKTFQILGSAETNPAQGIISYTSPIGAALIGSRRGDVIKIKLARNEVEYRIIEIE